MSTAECLVLGLINAGANYGHEMDKLLDKWQFRLWTKTNRSTIYQTLKKIEKKGWVSSQIEKVGNMPERKMYTITDEGKTSLQSMVAEGLASQDIVQFDHSIWIGFMYVLPPTLVIEQIEKRIHAIHKIVNSFPAEEEVGQNVYLGKRANVKFLRSYYRMELDWLDWCTEELKKE